MRDDEEMVEGVGAYKGVVEYEEMGVIWEKVLGVSLENTNFPSFRTKGFLKGLSFTLPSLSVFDIFC